MSSLEYMWRADTRRTEISSAMSANSTWLASYLILWCFIGVFRCNDFGGNRGCYSGAEMFTLNCYCAEVGLRK